MGQAAVTIRMDADIKRPRQDSVPARMTIFAVWRNW